MIFSLRNGLVFDMSSFVSVGGRIEIDGFFAVVITASFLEDFFKFFFFGDYFLGDDFLGISF